MILIYMQFLLLASVFYICSLMVYFIIRLCTDSYWYVLATKLLLTNGHAFKGSFIGYSPSGVPLYNIYNAGVKQTSHSITSVLKNGLKQILNESDSRKIFFFLCINLVSALELVYIFCFTYTQ